MRIIVGIHHFGPNERAALALALGFSEKAETIAVTAATRTVDATLRTALTLGAHRAIRIEGVNPARSDFHAIGEVLAAAAKHLKADLFVTGAASDDEGLGAVGGSVATRLAAPYIADVASLEPGLTGSIVIVTHAGGHRLRLQVPTPTVLAVLAVDSALVIPHRPPAVASPPERKIEILSLRKLGLRAAALRRQDDLLGVLERD